MEASKKEGELLPRFVPRGGTVRLDGGPALLAALLSRGILKKMPLLVVNDTLTSHFWLNLLPLSSNPLLRFYITESDLEHLSQRLHVRPIIAPAFVVIIHGYMIDWFPAPLPEPGCVADPQTFRALRPGSIPNPAFGGRTLSRFVYPMNQL